LIFPSSFLELFFIGAEYDKCKGREKENINLLSTHMKEIMEKLLNDKTARDTDKLMDIAAGENEFSTWD
jgi:hypothetical protein